MQCAYAALQGFLGTQGNKREKERSGGGAVNVYACFDNEEVGSGTKQGAGSTFLHDVLKRINTLCKGTEEDYYRAVAGSFMISADNAHAVHPNHPEKTDARNCAYMNEGIVIKSHAGQRSTLGNISSGKVSLSAVDVGLAQLAMHSAYETAGIKDTGYMASAIQEFFFCD